MSNTLSARISPTCSWNTSLEFFPGDYAHCSMTSSPLPRKQQKDLKLPQVPAASCQMVRDFSLLVSGWPAKMARSHQLYVTHSKAMSLRSGSFEWLLSCKCVTVTFVRDLGGEDQSSLICGTGTLQLLNDSVRCYLQPWKTLVPGTRGTWCKTLCHVLASRAHLLERWRPDMLKMPCVILGALLTPCQSQAGRSCRGRCLPTSPSRSATEWWLSSGGEEVRIKSSK